MGKKGNKEPPDPWWRWRSILLRLLTLMNSNRMSHLRLALDQTSQQSTRSSHRSHRHLERTEAQQACTHPTTARQNGGNQHAKWTKCGACGARLTYQSRGQASTSLLAVIADPGQTASWSASETSVPSQTLPSATDTESATQEPTLSAHDQVNQIVCGLSHVMQQTMAPLVHLMGELGNQMTMQHMRAQQSQEIMDKILQGYVASSLHHPMGQAQNPHGMMAQIPAQPIFPLEMQQQAHPHRYDMDEDWAFPDNQPSDQDPEDQEHN